MRYLCTWRYKDDSGKIIQKTEILTTKIKNVFSGQKQLKIKLATEYNLPITFVERDYEDEEQLGIFYINPKADNTPTELRDIVIDEELERYAKYCAETISNPYSQNRE